ncbi:MAG: hypothetical protein ABR585_00720, partial [Gemmatimonadaceae bacterium]
PLLRPPLLREEERLLDLREEDFREDDLRRLRDDFLPPDDFRALRERPPLDRRREPPLRPPLLLLLLRFRPPLLRPEDPDRDLFLPPLELDFLAAAIGKLRVGGFVEPIARFAHNKL